MRLPSIRSWRIQRDTTIWIVAVGLLVYEIVIRETLRPEVLTTVGLLLLSPVAIRGDESDKKKNGSS